MGNIGTPEILIILGVIVLIFGSTQLPKLARSLGKAQTEFKRGLKEGDQEDEEKPSK
jgi:sec-independent protein translocase protein TatA